MKYLLILFEVLTVYVGGYPGVFLKSCSFCHPLKMGRESL